MILVISFTWNAARAEPGQARSGIKASAREPRQAGIDRRRARRRSMAYLPAVPARLGTGAGPDAPKVYLKHLDRRHQLRDRGLGVSEEHHRLGVVEKLVLDAREARPHAPLENDDVLRLVRIENRH